MSNSLMNKHLYSSLLVIVMLFGTFGAQAAELPDFTGMVEQNSPAVVNISTKSKRSPRRLRYDLRIPDLPKNSPFNELFRHFFEEQPGRRGYEGGEGDNEGRMTPQSLGSGFIISSDGYIMTNNHVVDDADEIVVRLSDRREFEAEVIGGDKQSDTAILKIKAKDLPTVKIGKSNDLKVGEWVLAIGSPFGFDHSVTAGIVSAKGRSLPKENYVPFIQTDVAINPGNSGGPLFNLDGEVVGVNSQIYSRTGGFMGLSFAIPIEVAMNVADQLRTKGKVSRGWLGVLIQDVTKDLAESFGMKQPSGALVSRVIPDSPAEQAKLMPGDIIMEYNGKKLLNSSDLPPLVGSSDVNKPSKLSILRQGNKIELDVTIGELPSEDEMEVKTGSLGQASNKTLGIKVKDLSDEQLQKRKLSNGGVIVYEVGHGAGRLAGIKRGDIIKMLNGHKVSSVEDFKKAVEGLKPGKTVAVLVQRYAGPVFLALKVPGK
jgi:serine protease Do